MASTSSTRSNAAAGRTKSACTTIYSENQSACLEIRRAISTMKDIAVDLERDNRSEMVKEIEAAVIQLLDASEDGMHFSSAVQSIGNGYEFGEEPTDFAKLFDSEIVKSKSKAKSSSTPQIDPLLRQFREAVWNVHHPGEPMPGEEQEDIVMTSTQCNILNYSCPLTGKPLTELADPARSVDCKHIYEKSAIMQYICTNQGKPKCPCPMTGCPKEVAVGKIVSDELLKIEIEEMRSMSKDAINPNIIEDYTELDDEEDEVSD